MFDVIELQFSMRCLSFQLLQIRRCQMYDSENITQIFSWGKKTGNSGHFKTCKPLCLSLTVFCTVWSEQRDLMDRTECSMMDSVHRASNFALLYVLCSCNPINDNVLPLLKAKGSEHFVYFPWIPVLAALSILGAYAEFQKAIISFVMSVCPSVCPHGTTRLPRDGFS